MYTITTNIELSGLDIYTITTFVKSSGDTPGFDVVVDIRKCENKAIREALIESSAIAIKFISDCTNAIANAPAYNEPPDDDSETAAYLMHGQSDDQTYYAECPICGPDFTRHQHGVCLACTCWLN